MVNEEVRLDDRGAIANESRPLGGRYVGFTAGLALSTAGDAAWYVALSTLLTGAFPPDKAAALLAVTSIPRIIGLLVGGVVADRASRRTIMLVCDSVSLVVMGATATALYGEGADAVWIAFVAACALATANAFFVPAAAAIRPQLLARTQILKGNAAYSFGQRVGQAVGGAVGGLLTAIGVSLAALANTLSYFGSLFAIFFARPVTSTEHEKTPRARSAFSPLEDMREGLKYVLRQRPVAVVLLVLSINELSVAGPLNVGLAVFARDRGLGQGGAGVLLASFAVGSAVGASFVAWAKRMNQRAGWWFIGMLAAEILMLVAIGFAVPVVVAVAQFAVFGAFLSVSANLGLSMLLSLSNERLHGRVMSVFSLLAFATIPLGNLLFGLLVRYVGLTETFLVHAILCAFSFGLGLCAGSVRKAELA